MHVPCLQVVCIDHEADPLLTAHEERAVEATAAVASQGMAARVKALAKVVVESMGGSFDCNDTLAHFWQAESERQKKLHK